MNEIKNLIDEKFKEISHKWIKYNDSSSQFYKVLEILKNSDFSNNEKNNLLNKFNFHNFCWIKFKKYSGRSTITCECEIISENDESFIFQTDHNFVLDSLLLNGTPKSLKLFNTEKQKSWKKPDDGFTDDFKTPIDEELTEQGYILYKETHEELKSKNMTMLDYRKLNNSNLTWEKIPEHLIDLIK